MFKSTCSDDRCRGRRGCEDAAFEMEATSADVVWSMPSAPVSDLRLLFCVSFVHVRLDQRGWTVRVQATLINVALIHVCCRGLTAFFVITLDMKVSSALGMVTRRYFAMATRSNVDSTGVGNSSGIYVELCQRMDSLCCRQN